MTQLNIHMTPAFERNLQKFMEIRRIKNEVEAIHIALKEGLNHTLLQKKSADFSSWVGLGKQAPTNKKTKFHSDDKLWYE